MANECAEALEEELVALEAIYGEECCIADDRRSCQITVSFDDASQLRIAIYMPDNYPNHSPPLAEFSGRYIPPDQAREMLDGLQAAFQPGTAVIYEWIEWIKEQSSLADQLNQALYPEAEQQPSEGQTEVNEGCKGEPLQTQDRMWQQAQQDALVEQRKFAVGIVHGEPFTETKSKFQGHLVPVHSLEDVQMMMTCLMEDNKIQRATHNIMAYRIRLESGGVIQDCDDDGESAAGGRLLHLLQVTDAENVMIVVTRWYGGVLLGPARFTHINNAARVLLDKHGYIKKRKK